jgi:hypothetical protein
MSKSTFSIYIVLLLCFLEYSVNVQSISILINSLNDTITNSTNCYPIIQTNLCNFRSAFSACLLFSQPPNENCIINLPNQENIYLYNNIYGNLQLSDTSNIIINGYDSIIIGNYYSSFIIFSSNLIAIPSLTINNIQINHFGSTYAAIAVEGYINLNLSNIIFNENQGSLLFSFNNKESIIQNCSFFSNYNGNDNTDNNSSIIINNFGSIFLHNSSNIEITNSSFLSSSTLNGGGAILSLYSTDIKIFNSEFIDCNGLSSTSNGGGILFGDTQNIEISNNIFISNSGMFYIYLIHLILLIYCVY